MPNAVLMPEYWVLRNCARLVALRSSEVCAVLLLRPPGSLHSCAPLADLIRDVSCLDGFFCEFWCAVEACAAIVDACFSCKLVRGCLGDGSRSQPMLLSFRSSSLCTACYFRDMVWARSVLEFLRSGASLATWQGGVWASCMWGSKWDLIPFVYLPSPHCFILSLQHVSIFPSHCFCSGWSRAAARI